ncbi:GAF domain-containing protein [Actinomadura cremea]|nr:GAF domain-containing protein [Actinomadura cremea]
MVIRDGDRAARAWALIARLAGAEAVSVGHVCRAAGLSVGTDGATLSLVTGTNLRTLLYATDSAARLVDDAQFTLGEGPCIDAWTQGGPVLMPDLRSVEARTRWPWFAASAVESGVGAVFAFPLQVGAIRPGVLVLYRRSSGALLDGQLADALVFARAALTVTLDTARTDGAQGGSTPDLPGVLGWDRAEVYQATGMVAVQLDVGLDEALARLRAHAFTTDVSLADVAQRVLDRVLRFRPDGAGGSDAE